jgi:hypothetical protein
MMISLIFFSSRDSVHATAHMSVSGASVVGRAYARPVSAEMPERGDGFTS